MSRPPVPPPLDTLVADSHAHLDLDVAADDSTLESVIENARASGVGLIVHIGTDVASSEYGVSVVKSKSGVRTAVALHPNTAPEIWQSAGQAGLDDALNQISRLAKLPEVSAVGESGLDFYRTDEVGRPAQIYAFRAHIEIAMKNQKPLVVHDRDAHSEVDSILSEFKPPLVVLHCFSGDEELAREFVSRGYFISFAGNVTFKNSHALRRALCAVPLSQLLVETDSPFLTPMPYRGQINSPYLVPSIIRAIAEVREEPVIDVANATWQNTQRLFGDLP